MKTQYIRQWLGDVNENEPPPGTRLRVFTPIPANRPAEQSPPTTPPMGRRGLSEEEILNRTNMRERLFGKRKSPKPVKDKTFDLKPRHPTRPDRYESKDVLRAVDQVQASRKMKRNVLKKRHDANFHAANPSQLRVVVSV